MADNPDDYTAGLPQQKQNQFQGANQQGSQNEVRSTSLEKGTAALEAVWESMEHLKKAMDEAEKANRSYQAMQEECQKAFEVMQRVNFELKDNIQLLTQSGGKQNDKILNPEISMAFGTESVNEAVKIVGKSYLDYQKYMQHEPAQDSQKQFREPQTERSQTNHPREKTNFERVRERYEHHIPEHGRSEGREYGFQDFPKRPGKGLTK